ncbi:MAG: DUF2147 domain-containing protein [Alphaproteobacteria bacterium]|nr:DUF2147 domain-containing protein [Alphaproteobacteria bacterium]
MKVRTLAFSMSMIAAAGLFASVSTANAQGTYLRKGDQPIKVAISGGKLYCTRISDGFEMCNGMSKSGGKWTGGAMKHPDMPGFMTFNGTVIMSGSSLSIKGCAIGEAMCDSETWKKK